MRKLKNCTPLFLNVRIAVFIQDNYPRIVSIYRELFVDILDEENTVLLIGKFSEHHFICYLIWDEKKEEFIECKNIGLYDLKTGLARIIDAKDLQDEILKLYPPK